MESSLSESVQQLVRPGKCVDIYYPDPQTAEKQCFRTSVNTRYTQDFTNLGGGTSVFTIPPNNGIQDVIVSMALPAAASFPTGASTKLGVCRGWAYALIKQISFRYGGSSQYFLTGQQVLQAALSMASDSGSRDAILSLGGDALTNDGTTDGFATSKAGYVWLPLPHTVPSAEGKLPPLPSDLLTQQIQITVELFPLSKIFSIASGGSTANVPQALASAKFQVQQVLLENQGDALARRVDMTAHALSFPVNFRQQEVAIQLNGGASITPSSVTVPQTLSLTGFRSGEVREIHCWLTADSANTPVPAAATAQAPFAWYALQDAVMTYAGEVYARYDANSGQLWNLVNGRIPAQVNDVLPVASGATVTFPAPTADSWTVLPFGQAYDAPTAHSMYVAGKPITNGIVNLSFNIPKSAPTSTYTLHISYVYNAVLTFSQGSCDYVF
jgi:hypothetical protein